MYLTFLRKQPMGMQQTWSQTNQDFYNQDFPESSIFYYFPKHSFDLRLVWRKSCILKMSILGICLFFGSAKLAQHSCGIPAIYRRHCIVLYSTYWSSRELLAKLIKLSADHVFFYKRTCSFNSYSKDADLIASTAMIFPQRIGITIEMTSHK